MYLLNLLTSKKVPFFQIGKRLGNLFLSFFPCAKVSNVFDIKKKMTNYFHFYLIFMPYIAQTPHICNIYNLP